MVKEGGTTERVVALPGIAHLVRGREDQRQFQHGRERRVLLAVGQLAAGLLRLVDD
jgi:hypothetical protein